MRGGGGVREGGRGGVRGLFLKHEKKRIDRSWRSPSLYSRPWGPAPGAEAHNTISQHATRQVNVVNTREYICYYYLLAI